MSVRIVEGDCVARMAELDPASIDSIVTDPPYHLTSVSRGGHARTNDPAMPHGRHRIGDKGFMGKQWDGGDVAFRVETWAPALRVLKPGGHLLAFSGTRTYHRMVVAIEDAGFEIRDQLGWIYGSGFPKSKNLSGEWEGWGTALKPAWEPIVVARKPLGERNVAANTERYGTGALNIAACRIGDEVREAAFTSFGPSHGGKLGSAETRDGRRGTQGAAKEYVGRWPANILHDGSPEVVAGFPDAPGQQGDLAGQSEARASKRVYGDMPAARHFSARTDSATCAARFFYCAKATTEERGDENSHPTVKPAALMQWLCRLVTPPGGTVLDPFAGSGSTGIAADREGFNAVLIEREAEYVAIARRRIMSDSPLFAEVA